MRGTAQQQGSLTSSVEVRGSNDTKDREREELPGVAGCGEDRAGSREAICG